MKTKLLNIKGELLSLKKPVVMGILNVTPDSFFPDSRQANESEVIQRIETIRSEEGTWIDVGGYSTRPDALDVSMEDEWQRLEPTLQILMKQYPEMRVSVDTFRADIAKRAVEDYDVAIINDISGGSRDEKMFETVAELNVPYVLTHYFDKPQNVCANTVGKPITEDVMLYFAEKLQLLRVLGVKDVIIDPGFGFGKTLDQNYELLKNLNHFPLLFECPLCVGISRKRMIYNLLGCSVDESLNGTTVLNAYALLNGADLLRVHDVKAAVEAVKLIDKLIQLSR